MVLKLPIRKSENDEANVPIEDGAIESQQQQNVILTTASVKGRFFYVLKLSRCYDFANLFY